MDIPIFCICERSVINDGESGICVRSLIQLSVDIDCFYLQKLLRTKELLLNRKHL